MSTNLLGDLLVRIIGDKSQLDKTLKDSEASAATTGKNITNNLSSQFKEIDSILGGLGSKIAALLANPLVLAAAAAVGATKAFSDTTKELVAYGANIQETSEKTGLSIKSLQEYKYIAEQTGGSLESITLSIKMMTRGLETNKDTFAQLGIQTKDANGAFRSTTDIFNDTIGALGNLSNDTERTNLALKLFGRGALDMVPLLKQGSKGLEELRQKAHDLGLVLSDETITKSHDLEKATASLGTSWKAFTMTLASGAIPVINNISNALINTITIMNSWRQASKNVDIVNNYKKGRDSVIEYHDALHALIDYNQKIIDSDTATANNKKIASDEIAKDYHLLDQAARDYGAAMGEANKKAAASEEAEAAAAKIKEEENRINALRITRDAATKEYEDSLSKTSALEKNGLLTHEAAQKAVNEATQKYAEALTATVEASKNSPTGPIGIESLNKILPKIKEVAQQEKANADDKKAYEDAMALREKTYSEAVQKQIKDEEKERTEATAKYNAEVQERNAIISSSSAAYDKLKKGEFRTFDDIEKEKIAAEKSGAIEEIDIEKATLNAKLKLSATYAQNVVSILSSLISKMSSIYQQDAQNQKDAIASKLSAAESAIDKELQAKLKALGLADKTAVETAQDELDAAIASGDAATIAEKQKALEKAKLEQEAADKKTALEKQAAIDTYKVELSAFKTNQQLSIVQALISSLEGAVAAYKALAGIPFVGPVLGAAAAAAMINFGAKEIAVIKAQVPPSPPSLATGGWGSTPTLAQVFDNPNADEAVHPLDDNFYNRLGDGLINALASRSRPAGVTERSVAAMAGESSGGSSSVTKIYQVGTLVASDGSMRTLTRAIRKFDQQETVRTGQ